MPRWFWLWFGVLVRVFRLRRSLLLENLALRQQLTVLKRKHPKPKLRVLDKLFWVSLAAVGLPGDAGVWWLRKEELLQGKQILTEKLVVSSALAD